MAKFVKGDVAGAQADLEKLVVVNPKDQTAQYNLAVVYFQGGQTDKAKAAWVAAAEIDPTSELGKMSQQFVDMMAGSTAPRQQPPWRGGRHDDHDVAVVGPEHDEPSRVTRGRSGRRNPPPDRPRPSMTGARVS